MNDCTIIGPLLIGFFVFGSQMQVFQTLLKFLPSRMCFGSTVVLVPAHSSRYGAKTSWNTIWNSVGLIDVEREDLVVAVAGHDVVLRRS